MTIRAEGLRRAGLVATVVFALAAFMAPVPSQAAIVSGSNLQATPGGAPCAFLEPSSCTLAIDALPGTSSAPGGARAGASGVIVGWKVRRGAGFGDPVQVRLRVVHGTGGSQAAPAISLSTDEGIYSFGARVPVQAGDQIGIDMLEVSLSNTATVLGSTPQASTDSWVPALGDPGYEPSSGPLTGLELLVNATIEPDADGDGFGDETQDPCPGAANAAAPCPVPTAAAPAPDTRVTETRIEDRRATFRFRSVPAGAKFECKLDGKPYKPCRSPRSYRKLAPGKHRFRVRAVAASGARDPSPAKRTFRIKP